MSHRLLLIEPNESVAAPIAALLEQNGFAVDVAAGVAEARAADLLPYALLIVDVKRDQREGLELVQWLYGEQPHMAGRVVVMSADDSDALAQDLAALGVCDVVPKPIDAREILRAVFDCLEQNPVHALQ